VSRREADAIAFPQMGRLGFAFEHTRDFLAERKNLMFFRQATSRTARAMAQCLQSSFDAPRPHAASSALRFLQFNRVAGVFSGMRNRRGGSILWAAGFAAAPSVLF
jgi:hypothetical protein